MVGLPAAGSMFGFPSNDSISVCFIDVFGLPVVGLPILAACLGSLLVSEAFDAVPTARDGVGTDPLVWSPTSAIPIGSSGCVINDLVNS